VPSVSAVFVFGTTGIEPTTGCDPRERRRHARRSTLKRDAE
jgi:hypothetical protein